jgi:small subunit ribosomal protein S20
MPITSSAKKALRAGAKKRVFNLRRKDAMNSTLKKIKKFISDKNTKEALALLAQAYKAIDKSAKTNLISKNTAARKKSRIAKAIARADK